MCPGVAAPLNSAGCCGNCWCDSLLHRILAYVSVLVKGIDLAIFCLREGGARISRSISENDVHVDE